MAPFVVRKREQAGGTERAEASGACSYRRRTLVAALGAGLVGAIPSVAQVRQRPWRIAVLGANEQANPWVGLFRDAMRDLGHEEGRDYTLEVRWAMGSADRARAIAREFVQRNVDLIVAQGSEATQAAKQATSSIPIVFSGPSYPVEEQLVASFARPGGNVTGFTVAMSDTVSKHLQILREVVPKLSDVGVVWSPGNPGHRLALRNTEQEAAPLGIKVRAFALDSDDEMQGVLDRIARDPPAALIVWPTASRGPEQVKRIGALAARLRVPTITTFKGLTRAGILMSYGPDVRDSPRRVAIYVDRILKGTRPGDLPVERPTKFELVINLVTAKALGLTLPQSLLLRADELIE